MTAPAAPRAPPKAQVIRKWVWGESLEVGEEEEEETKGGEGEVVAPMPKQAHEQGKMNTAKLDTGHVGRGDGGKKAFIDSPSSTFDSTCRYTGVSPSCCGDVFFAGCRFCFNIFQA